MFEEHWQLLPQYSNKLKIVKAENPLIFLTKPGKTREFALYGYWIGAQTPLGNAMTSELAEQRRHKRKTNFYAWVGWADAQGSLRVGAQQKKRIEIFLNSSDNTVTIEFWQYLN